MDDHDFYVRLQREIESTRDSFGLPNNSRGFVAWLGLHYFEIDDREEVDNGICDGGNDQGIDGMFFDEDDTTVEVIQVKLPKEANIRKSFPESEIIKTLAGVELVLSGSFLGKVAPRLEELAKRLHDLVNNSGYKVRVTFLSLLGPPSSTTYVNEFRRKNSGIEVRFFGFDELMAFFVNEYLLRRAQPPEKIAFLVVGDILEKKEPKPSAVFTISAADLAKSVLEHGARLFQDNVRLFLGSRVKSTNIRIRETAESNSESSLFWYYNNGINIVCKQIEVAATRKVVTLHRPQIVNGAQTSFALSRALKDGKLRPNTLLLAKAIQETDRNFVSNLTLYTNSQNPVRLRDFAANDAEQIAISKICRALGFYYEKKRGEFNDDFPTKGEREKALGPDWRNRVIDNERVAQCYVAWELQRPAEGRRDKRRLFSKENDGLYRSVFNARTIPEAMVFLHLLDGFVTRRGAEYEKGYAILAAEKDQERRKRILRDEFLLHSDLFLIALVRWYLADERGIKLFDQKAYVGLIQAMKGAPLFNAVHDQIVGDLRPFFATKKKDPTYYHNKFFKSEKAFGELLYHLKNTAGREFVAVE